MSSLLRAARPAAARAAAAHTAAASAAAPSACRSVTSLASASSAAGARFPWQRVLTGAVALTALATGARAVSHAAPASDAAASAAAGSAARAIPGTDASSLPLASSAPPASGKVKIALVQLGVGSNKAANVDVACSRIEEAVAQGAKLVVLPEMFNCPYANASFGPYSETLPGVGATAAEVAAMEDAPTARAMSALARKHGIWLVAGSVPERAPSATGARHPKTGSTEHLYNTCLVFDPSGRVVARHRKLHLFDIDVPGKVRFCESDTLSAGPAAPTLFDTPFGRVGVGICYDIRFGEYASLLAARGASLLVYPGAFNTVTGPLHWELLQRARAVDNQAWVLTCSPARAEHDPTSYQAWGHSSAISPWGRVRATTEHQPAVVVTEIDMAEVEDMRKSIPVRTQKRTDIYKTQA